MPSPRLYTPIPDPTLLTTAQLLREIEQLKELLEQRISTVKGELELFKEHSLSLGDERLRAVHEMFHERDIRFDQMNKDRANALDAAFASTKEATSKSELAFNKQMDQLTANISTMANTFDSKITDVKDRFNRTEGIGLGSQETVSSTRSMTSIGINIVMALVALGALAITLLRK